MTRSVKSTALTINRKLADPNLWHHEGREVSLGCVNCPERPWCGGLATNAELFSCMDLCCGQPNTCEQYACPQ